MQSVIEISDLVGSSHWKPDLAHCQKWVDETLRMVEHQPRCSVSLSFIDEMSMQSLNNDFRAQNKPTNVLSFPAQIPEFMTAELDAPPLGDVVVCAAVLSQEATDQGKDLSAHWAHLIIHGTLHLLGFDHQTAEDALKMESLEITILASFGISNPYGLG